MELTDPQWDAISPFFNLERKRKLNLRQVMNALLYVVRTGCQWRNLPPQWPNWQAVYYYFDKWKNNGLFEKINRIVNQLDRKQEGREEYPSFLLTVKALSSRREFLKIEELMQTKKLMGAKDSCL